MIDRAADTSLRPAGDGRTGVCVEGKRSFFLDNLPLRVTGFPEESEKFCTPDEIFLVNNYFQVLQKRAAHMRIGASASNFAATSVNTSQLAGSKNNVLSIR
jgi:hypothetical protein